MKYPKYPKYKDSGIEWLGEVPSQWGVKRLKFCVALRNDKTQAVESSLPYLGLENIEPGTARKVESEIPIEPEGMTNRYFGGDVLFGKLRPYLAKVYESEEEGLCTTELLVLHPTGIDKSFLKYQLLSDEFIKIVDSSTYGAKMPRANWDFIGNMPLALPSKSEQTAIAAVLDAETAQIDTLITKQERLIALLQEKRQALISHAVTRGLNPAAPMKDSGVEWLGEIPAHWETKRNQWIFSEVNERSTTGEEELLSVSHITGVTPRSEKNVNMFMAETLEGYKLCQPGDLIINTMWAYMGALGMSDRIGLVSPSYNVYRLVDPSLVNSTYLDYLYRTPAHIVEIKRNSKGVWESRLRLYPANFLAMQTPLPPRNEQDEIVARLERKLNLFATVEQKCLSAIAVLQERRTALISAAVTGKIDVRTPMN